MNFWKKLFAGMGFVCGFLVFETMSLAYHNPAAVIKTVRGAAGVIVFGTRLPGT